MLVSTTPILILILLSSVLASPQPSDWSDYPNMKVRIYPSTHSGCHGDVGDYKEYPNPEYRVMYDRLPFQIRAFWLERALNADESLGFSRNEDGFVYHTVRAKDSKKGCNHIPKGKKAADAFKLHDNRG